MKTGVTLGRTGALIPYVQTGESAIDPFGVLDYLSREPAVRSLRPSIRLTVNPGGAGDGAADHLHQQGRHCDPTAGALLTI